MKRVLVLTTGGTIGGHARSPEQDPLGAEMIAECAKRAGEHAVDKWGYGIDIVSNDVANIDSSNVTPAIWMKLIDSIVASYDDFDGFVITHGTNTMGYTAAALAFAISNSLKPIVLTGAQVPLGIPGSDGTSNLENAIRIASYPARRRAIGGVVTVFGSNVIAGVRTQKSTDFEIDALVSFAGQPIGRIGRLLAIDDGALALHQSCLYHPNGAATAAQLSVKAGFDMEGILSLTEMPGMTSRQLERYTESDGLRAVILRSFGSGDASSGLRTWFDTLKRQEVPVVVTTQAPHGRASLRVNQPGIELIRDELAIPAEDMSIEALTVKLGWLLAQGHSYGALALLMNKNLRGEISESYEAPW